MMCTAVHIGLLSVAPVHTGVRTEVHTSVHTLASTCTQMFTWHAQAHAGTGTHIGQPMVVS